MAVEVTVTSKLQNVVEKVLGRSHISGKLRKNLIPYTRNEKVDSEGEIEEKKAITFALVRDIWEAQKAKVDNDDNEPVYLHELLEGSEIYIEPPKPPERSPELVARLHKLKAKQEQKEYNKMVANVGPTWNEKKSSELATEVRSTTKQVSSIVNFLLSLIAAFVFGFVSSQYAFPQLAMRVIIGTLLACTVALAELYFMARTEI